MICPKCAVQMYQYNQIGGGEAKEDIYTTWEVKKCPSCNRLVKEVYQCVPITVEQVATLEMQRGLPIIKFNEETK